MVGLAEEVDLAGAEEADCSAVLVPETAGLGSTAWAVPSVIKAAAANLVEQRWGIELKTRSWEPIRRIHATFSSRPQILKIPGD